MGSNPTMKNLIARHSLTLLWFNIGFSKVPNTFRARKAIPKTPNRLFRKAGLFMCCEGNKN